MLKIPKYCKIKLIMPRIKFFIITLFPDALRPYLDSSMLYKAQDRGIIEIEYVNLREFGIGPHRSVDDTPYGGGDGMLMRVEPVFAAIESIKAESPNAKVIVPTPVGQTWNQALAREFAGISQKVVRFARVFIRSIKFDSFHSRIHYLLPPLRGLRRTHYVNC